MKLFNIILSPSPNWCCCGEKLRKALLWASRSWVLWRCRPPKTDGSATRLETSGRRGRRRVNFLIKPIYYWNYAPKQENKLISPFRPENNDFHCKYSWKYKYFQDRSLNCNDNFYLSEMSHQTGSLLKNLASNFLWNPCLIFQFSYSKFPIGFPVQIFKNIRYILHLNP